MIGNIVKSLKSASSGAASTRREATGASADCGKGGGVFVSSIAGVHIASRSIRVGLRNVDAANGFGIAQSLGDDHLDVVVSTAAAPVENAQVSISETVDGEASTQGNETSLCVGAIDVHGAADLILREAPPPRVASGAMERSLLSTQVCAQCYCH